MSVKKADRTSKMYYIHLVIGFFFMFVFPHFPAVDPLTPVGMKVLGILIGMVYFWSTVNSIWPSLLGLVMIGFAGMNPELQGYAAVKDVFLNSFGLETVVFVMLAMILFASIEYVGCTKYIVRFFLSIKALNGRPYVFFFILFLCSYFISGLSNTLAPLLILWPIVIEICEMFGYKKTDKIFYTLICGIYLGATLGQPLLPFKGAPFAILSAFTSMSGVEVNYGAYIIYSFVMGMMLLLAFMAVMKFIIRPDVEGFKSVNVEQLNQEELPKMNAQQWTMLIVLFVFVILMLLPNFLSPEIPGIGMLNRMGLLGITCALIIILMIIPYKGGKMLDFIGIAKKSFNWNVYMIVPAAVYICTAVTNDATGIKPWLVQTLNPLLGGKPGWVFVLIILLIALIATNFGNNNGMAIIVIPVALAYADQYPNMNMIAVCMSIALIVFVALMTPAASPYCSVLHGRKDLVNFGQIARTFMPMIVVAIVAYAFIGIRIANALF